MSLTKKARRAASATGTAVAIAALLAGTVAVAAPASADTAPGCSGAKQQKVADVTRDVANGDDYGSDGHIWALDTYLDHLQLWRVSPNHYCLRLEDSGTFVSFAGVSPNTTGTVSAGVTGSWSGVGVVYFTAEFAPTVPVKGYIGRNDQNCDQSGSCTNALWATDYFFSHGYTVTGYGSFQATFNGGSHGTWVQNGATNTGDITG